MVTIKRLDMNCSKLFYLSHLCLFFVYGVTLHGIERQNPISCSTVIEEYLASELNDATIAKELTTVIVETILARKARTIAVAQITTIIAYAFGNRILPNGNRLSGPMNEALAELVVQLHQKTNVPVYSQWEVAEAIGDRIASETLIVINPVLDAQANAVYLSTAGVVAAIVQHSGDPQKLGKVGVIAFNDHLYRCVTLSCDVGMDAYALEGYTMPNDYDPHSGQPWARNRLTYLVADLRARVTNYFEKLVKS